MCQVLGAVDHWLAKHIVGAVRRNNRVIATIGNAASAKNNPKDAS